MPMHPSLLWCLLALVSHILNLDDLLQHAPTYHDELPSSLPLPVYDTLFTSTNDGLSMLWISRSDVEKLLKRVITLWERFVDIFSKTGQSFASSPLSASPLHTPCSLGRDMAYHYKLTSTCSLDPISTANDPA
ncbi:hypothetical protein H4582DRAFT_2085144 [Lactarius indigo]|nr:hypothetical protein H4582DRAFT_2085144 [Lactarius indigo]